MKNIFLYFCLLLFYFIFAIDNTTDRCADKKKKRGDCTESIGIHRNWSLYALDHRNAE